MLKVDKPQYNLDHDGNYLFVIHILGNPGAEFTATVDVRMQGTVCFLIHIPITQNIQFPGQFCP
jgi:hypothetical protein